MAISGFAAETTDNKVAIEQLALSKWKEQIVSSPNGIRLQMNKNAIPDLVKDAVEMNINILAIQPRHSLEDYFLSLTTRPHHVDTTAN